MQSCNRLSTIVNIFQSPKVLYLLCVASFQSESCCPSGRLDVFVQSMDAMVAIRCLVMSSLNLCYAM